jgi:hypothetical protein
VERIYEKQGRGWDRLKKNPAKAGEAGGNNQKYSNGLFTSCSSLFVNGFVSIRHNVSENFF